jgi:hypothetical protein
MAPGNKSKPEEQFEWEQIDEDILISGMARWQA